MLEVCFFVCVLTVGDCESAMAGAFFMETKYVLTYLYSAKTKPYKDFIKFVMDSLKVYHDTIRKGDTSEPIMLAIESQKAWDGNLNFL